MESPTQQEHHPRATEEEQLSCEQNVLRPAQGPPKIRKDWPPQNVLCLTRWTDQTWDFKLRGFVSNVPVRFEFKKKTNPEPFPPLYFFFKFLKNHFLLLLVYWKTRFEWWRHRPPRANTTETSLIRVSLARTGDGGMCNPSYCESMQIVIQGYSFIKSI